MSFGFCRLKDQPGFIGRGDLEFPDGCGHIVQEDTDPGPGGALGCIQVSGETFKLKSAVSAETHIQVRSAECEFHGAGAPVKEQNILFRLAECSSVGNKIVLQVGYRIAFQMNYLRFQFQ